MAAGLREIVKFPFKHSACKNFVYFCSAFNAEDKFKVFLVLPDCLGIARELKKALAREYLFFFLRLFP